MNSRQVRLGDVFDTIDRPLARLGMSLRDDREAVFMPEEYKSDYELLATDGFLQRFQQTTDLVLRKLFPRLLAVLEESDIRQPFGAMLDRLDGYEVLSDVPWWIELNELRNQLIHEYIMSVEERAAGLRRAWDAAERLRSEIMRIRSDEAMAKRLVKE